jgi:hypothetical protein
MFGGNKHDWQGYRAFDLRRLGTMAQDKKVNPLLDGEPSANPVFASFREKRSLSQVANRGMACV